MLSAYLQVGHLARECPSKPAAAEGYAPKAAGDKPRRRPNGGSRGVGSKRCFNCGQNGHLSADCGVAAGNTACYSCGQNGHKSVDCPSKA